MAIWDCPRCVHQEKTTYKWFNRELSTFLRKQYHKKNKKVHSMECAKKPSEQTHRVVYFKSHNCNSQYGASRRCTSVLSTCYLLIWYILTRTTEVMEHEQTRENVWSNVNGVKNCKKQSFVVHQYSIKNSCKYIKTILKVSQINTIIQKLQKNFVFLGIFSV